MDSTFKTILQRCHNKNVLEWKHGVIRSIFLRLMSDDDDNKRLRALQAVRVSNDLCSSDILSDFEMAKGFTKQVDVSSPILEVSQDLLDAPLQLQAKRKPTLILRSKSVTDLVEDYVKHDKENRGKWLTPRTILSIHSCSSTVTVPASNGRSMDAVSEEVRAANI